MRTVGFWGSKEVLEEVLEDMMGSDWGWRESWRESRDEGAQREREKGRGGNVEESDEETMRRVMRLRWGHPFVQKRRGRRAECFPLHPSRKECGTRHGKNEKAVIEKVIPAALAH